MHGQCIKPCTKCGIPKSYDDFFKDKHHPTGRTARCRACQKKTPSTKPHWRLNDSGICRRCGKGPDEVVFGIDKHLALGMNTICNSCRSLDAKANWANNRDRMSAYMAERRKRVRMEVLIHYGGLPPFCACCGETQREFLAIDHINGGGRKHERERKSGDLAEWLRRNGLPPGFRVLCHSCNCAIRYSAPCPHKEPNWFKPMRTDMDVRVFRSRMRKRMLVLTRYGGDPPECACCGEKEVRFLAMDHIAGGGRRHVDEHARSSIYNILIDDGFPLGFQVLCTNCNQAKGAYGECPHQRTLTATIDRSTQVEHEHILSIAPQDTRFRHVCMVGSLIQAVIAG